MSLRQIKRRAMRNMAMPPIEYMEANPGKLYYTHNGDKPCRSYDAWCCICNGHLFRKAKGRYPYGAAEFYEFEQQQQAKEKANERN